jgi:large subunit ribosomal protein L30
MKQQLKVTLIKSVNGATTRQKQTVMGLGLRKKINTTRMLDDTPANRGMISKVHFLLKWETCHEYH